jgi:hypothetical protein
MKIETKQLLIGLVLANKNDIEGYKEIIKEIEDV